MSYFCFYIIKFLNTYFLNQFEEKKWFKFTDVKYDMKKFVKSKAQNE